MGICDGCPPFGGAICGITDTFNPNQFNARPNGVDLGYADCGRLWTVQLANPMTIENNLMRVPTGIVGDTSASLPGDYPVPFNGRIVAVAADIHPGFTYERDGTEGATDGFGAGTWLNGGVIVNAGVARIGGGITGGSIGSGGSLVARADRKFFNAAEGFTISGHIAVIETVADTKELDEYINVVIAPFTQIVNSFAILGSPPGGTGDEDVALLYIEKPGLAPSYAAFPANFWRDAGEADFVVSYTGGAAGTLTAIVGGVTTSLTMVPGTSGPYPIGTDGRAGITNHSYYVSGGAGDAEADISDYLIDTKAITDLGWEWQLNGTDSGGGGVAFRFGYVSMGGDVPFDFTEPLPEISGLWPWEFPTPAIWAYRLDLLGEQLTVVPLAVDLTWPFTPVVTIAGTTATLNIGGAVASVATAFPVITLEETLGGLTHMARNGQGTPSLFNDLDVIGVNLCTETGITSGRPNRDQEVRDEYVGLGDGTTTTFYTDYPYQPGTLAIDVAGMLGDLDSADPPVGAFTLVDAPPAGAVVRATYRVASAPAPPVLPPLPGLPPGTPGTRPFAAPVTTNTESFPGGVDDTGATDAWPDLQAWIDGAPDGSILEFPPGGTYLLSRGLLFQQRNHLDVRGAGVTLLLDPGFSGNEQETVFLMRGSHHISIDDFTVTGTDWGFPSVSGESAHCLATSGFFNQGVSTYIEMHNVTATYIHGDAIYLEGNNAAPYPPSDHVWVHSCAFDFLSRNGISLIAVRNALIELVSIDHANYHMIDFEPNFTSQLCDGVTIRDCTFGSYAHRGGLLGFFVRDEGLPGTGQGSLVRNATIDNNTVDGIAANGYDGTPRGLNSRCVSTAGVRHKTIAITNNSTGQSVDTTIGAGGVLYFAHIDGIDVTGNTQPLGVGGELARFDDSTDITGP